MFPGCGSLLSYPVSVVEACYLGLLAPDNVDLLVKDLGSQLTCHMCCRGDMGLGRLPVSLSDSQASTMRALLGKH